MNRPLKLSALLLATTSPVFAQDVIVLDDIIVTAGYTDTSIDQTGASIEVLGADTLAQANTSIVQTFEGVAGVNLNTNGGVGTQAGIVVRGLNQNYVGVRVDGMDVTDPSGTQVSYDFGGLNGMDFAQAEFLKGSQSAVFGSEAVAGVISLKTLSNAEIGQHGTATLEMGSNGTLSAGVKAENIGENGAAAISISHMETDGFSAQNTGAGADEADPYSGDQLRVSLEHNLSPDVQLTFAALKSSEDISYDGYVPLTDTIARTTGVIIGGVAFQTGAVNHKISLSTGKFSRTYDWGSTYLGQRDEIEYKGQAALGNATTVTFGANRTEEGYQGDGVSYSGIDRAFFVEANQSVTDAIDVSAAIRHTKSNDFGNNTSQRLAGVVRLSNDIKLRAMASTGFRAPSLNERFGQYQYYDEINDEMVTVVYGNSDLTPESSESFEFGIEKSYANGSYVSITAFKSEVTGLIEYTGTYEQDNSKKRTAKGIELSGQYVFNPALSMTASYTYTDAKDDGVAAVRVPEHDVAVGVNANINDKIRATVSLNHIAGYSDVGGAMPDYTVVNASTSYDMTDTIQGYVRIQNLMDSDYETIKGYNTGGRQIFVGVRAAF